MKKSKSKSKLDASDRRFMFLVLSLALCVGLIYVFAFVCPAQESASSLFSRTICAVAVPGVRLLLIICQGLFIVITLLLLAGVAPTISRLCHAFGVE